MRPKHKSGGWQGWGTICAKSGHNARDCLLFMQREGTCGHWFMYSIGIYETGCTYGASCKKKHERPSIEPPETNVVTAAGCAKPVSSMSTGAKRVSIMATGATPKGDGDEYVLEELPASVIKSGRCLPLGAERDELLDK